MLLKFGSDAPPKPLPTNSTVVANDFVTQATSIAHDITLSTVIYNGNTLTLDSSNEENQHDFTIDPLPTSGKHITEPPTRTQLIFINVS